MGEYIGSEGPYNVYIGGGGYGEYIPGDDDAEDMVEDDDELEPSELLRKFVKEVKYFHYDPKGAGLKGKSLIDDHQKERLDPQHRFIASLGPGTAPARTHLDNTYLEKALACLLEFLGTKKLIGGRGTTEQFIEYVKIQRSDVREPVSALIEEWKNSPPPDFKLRGYVKYLDILARQKYAITPEISKGGAVLCRRKLRKGAISPKLFFFDSVPFDTMKSLAAYGNRLRKAIWVQAPSGRFYSSTKSSAGKFHHSSFLSGRNVSSAGDWEVIDGELRTISAVSGHYHPTLESLRDALLDLKRTAAGLLKIPWQEGPTRHPGCMVELVKKSDGGWTKVPALEFLEKAQRVGYLAQFKPSD